MHTKPLVPADDQIAVIIVRWRDGKLTDEQVSQQLNAVCRQRNNTELFVLENKIKKKNEV